MDRLIVGKGRKNNTRTERRREADFLFALGCVAVCFTLIITMFEGTEKSTYDNAIPVMSTGVETLQTDEMTRPEKDAGKTEEWSFYDYIGQMIADILFGES